MASILPVASLMGVSGVLAMQPVRFAGLGRRQNQHLIAAGAPYSRYQDLASRTAALAVASGCQPGIECAVEMGVTG